MSNEAQAATKLGQIKDSVGNSAEYAVALGLLLVCTVVGVAVWLAGGDDAEVAPEASLAPNAAVTTAASEQKLAEEMAALKELQEQLRASMQEVEERGRQEAAALERERAEEAERQAAALAAQQKAAAEQLAKLEAEIAARKQRAEEEAARIARAKAQAKTEAREPVRTSAAVRWDTCSKPQYPRASRLAGEEGLVVLAVDVNELGEVLDGRIQESSGSIRLDNATLRAVRKCDFDPATVDGKPVAVTGLIEFNWSLR